MSRLKLFVVAGNYQEFQEFVIRKRMKGFSYDFVYVSDRNTIRGLDTIRGFYIGTYRHREDWVEIRDAIAIIKAKENHVVDDLDDINIIESYQNETT
jgi:hypothetical protein